VQITTCLAPTAAANTRKTTPDADNTDGQMTISSDWCGTPAATGIQFTRFIPWIRWPYGRPLPFHRAF